MPQAALNIWSWVGKHLWEIVLLLSIFIQITPIKINPWSSLFNWIGKLITADTRKDIDDLKKMVYSQREIMNENEMDRIRWEVLDFANSCRNNRRHTKDEFQHIIALNNKYKKLLQKTGEKNGVFELEYEYIQRLYKKCQEDNDFL